MPREFVRITTETVYFLDTPEQIETARSALDQSRASSAMVWSTPSDEHDPEVSPTGQRLTRHEPEAKQAESEPVPNATAEESDPSHT